MPGLAGGDLGYCAACGAKLTDQGTEPLRCANCGQFQWRDPKVAAGILVGRDGKVLLVQRSHEPGLGRWSFPSGYVDRGEVVEEAAIREAREEACVEVSITGLLGVFSERGNPVVFIAFEGVTESEPSAGPEAMAVGYFDPRALPPLAFEHDHVIIEAWRSRSGQASS